MNSSICRPKFLYDNCTFASCRYSHRANDALDQGLCYCKNNCGRMCDSVFDGHINVLCPPCHYRGNNKESCSNKNCNFWFNVNAPSCPQCFTPRIGITNMNRCACGNWLMIGCKFSVCRECYCTQKATSNYNGEFVDGRNNYASKTQEFIDPNYVCVLMPDTCVAGNRCVDCVLYATKQRRCKNFYAPIKCKALLGISSKFKSCRSCADKARKSTPLTFDENVVPIENGVYLTKPSPPNSNDESPVSQSYDSSVNTTSSSSSSVVLAVAPTPNASHADGEEEDEEEEEKEKEKEKDEDTVYVENEVVTTDNGISSAGESVSSTSHDESIISDPTGDITNDTSSSSTVTNGTDVPPTNASDEFKSPQASFAPIVPAYHMQSNSTSHQHVQKSGYFVPPYTRASSMYSPPPPPFPLERGLSISQQCVTCDRQTEPENYTSPFGTCNECSVAAGRSPLSPYKPQLQQHPVQQPNYMYGRVGSPIEGTSSFMLPYDQRGIQNSFGVSYVGGGGGGVNPSNVYGARKFGPIQARKQCKHKCGNTVRLDSVFDECTTCYMRANRMSLCTFSRGCSGFTNSSLRACVNCHQNDTM